MSWKPIDIAPRDGTTIVVAYRSPMSGEVTVSLSWWDDDEGWEADCGSDDPEPVGGLVPFAWVELPES